MLNIEQDLDNILGMIGGVVGKQVSNKVGKVEEMVRLRMRNGKEVMRLRLYRKYTDC